jgi:hypothetical protein
MIPALSRVFTSTRKMLVPSRNEFLRPPVKLARTDSRNTFTSSPKLS